MKLFFHLWKTFFLPRSILTCIWTANLFCINHVSQTRTNADLTTSHTLCLWGNPVFNNYPIVSQKNPHLSSFISTGLVANIINWNFDCLCIGLPMPIVSTLNKIWVFWLNFHTIPGNSPLRGPNYWTISRLCNSNCIWWLPQNVVKLDLLKLFDKLTLKTVKEGNPKFLKQTKSTVQ